MEWLPKAMALLLGISVLYELISGKVWWLVEGNSWRPLRDEEPVVYWLNIVIKSVAALALAGLLGIHTSS